MSEPKIFFTSDTHFGHDRDFVFAKRGFQTVEEMNEAIVRNWNRVVAPGDEVYHLGDVYLMEDSNIDYIRRLAGRIHIIRGNHDTDNKIEALQELPNIKTVSYAEPFQYKKWHFFLCHYPTLTCDTRLTEENLNKGLRSRTICLCGHTHQQNPFFNEQIPYIYNVGVDSHNCTPICIDDIMEEIKTQHQILQNDAVRHHLMG